MNKGSAAVETALVMPIFLVLIFGSFELGNYFLDNHLLSKAMREGARYASRSVALSDTCAHTIASVATVQTNTQNLVTYGKFNPIQTDKAPLPNWTVNKIQVTFRCDKSGSFAGLYRSYTDGVPVVTVHVDPNNGIQYSSLFSSMGFNSASLYLMNASSEVPVMGL